MWQPIETAPKDRFLLLCGPSGYTTTPRVFATGCMYSDYHVGRWVDHANDDLSDWGFEPTHWMPLPELPGAQPAPSVPACADIMDAARYRWLRENGRAHEKRESRAVLPRGGKKASMAFRYWTTPEELDMTIDAMLAAPEAKR